MRNLTGILTLALWAGTATAASAPQAQVDSDRFQATIDVNPASAAAVTARCDAAETLAKRLMTELAARSGAATIDVDFRSFDALTNLIWAAQNDGYLISQTSIAKPVRDAGQVCSERMSAIGTDLSLSRPIYDRLVAIPANGLDAATRFTLDKTLQQYRLAGVDRDAATRARIITLTKQITATGLAFDRNISEDRSEVTFANADALAGLPRDYLDAHKPAADGRIQIGTSYPDVIPILLYANHADTRKAMYLTFNNRAHPANDAVLKQLLVERAQLAKALGFANYATLATSDKMIETPGHAWAFLDEVNAAASPAAADESRRLLARLRQIDPTARALSPWDRLYLTNLISKEQYDVDSELVRQYFTLDTTRSGIFALVHDLFGSDIKPWNTPVWAPDVSAWELYDGARLVGRFFLDLSPREGKYSHAAQFPLRTGLAGRQVPVGALLTNFPATGPMAHEDVTTFLHEFGHLLHAMYSGRQRFGSQSMGNLEWDFIEAPSQLLEEWTWDYDTLRAFAANPAGEPIPAALVAKMNAGRHFGEAMDWKSQLGYSAVSLGFYDRPADFDLATMYRRQSDKYTSIPASADAHQYASFGHLTGYSAIYYTYAWSKAIALDLATRFRKAGLRDPATAMAYRKTVLEQGGSVPAATLIQAFLGRPFNTDAIREELAQRAAPAAAAAK